MRSINKSEYEMTAQELRQRMFELNGIQQPKDDAPNQEWNAYFKACLLGIGMSIYNDKAKAQQFADSSFTHPLN